MRTAVVSDLHLGGLAGADVARSGRPLDALVDAVSDADRLVLLGDIVELRERPLAEALEVARPVLERLGAAMAGRPVVLVPGNHDHALAEPWLARLRLAGERLPARRSGRSTPGDGAAGRIAEWMPDVRADARLPGAAAARRRLRHPRPLPRPASDHAAARVDRGVRDGADHEARPRRALGRGLRDHPGAAVRLLRRARRRAPRRLRSPGAAASRAPSGSGRATAAGPRTPTRALVATRERASAAATRFLLGRVTIPGAVAALNVLGLGPFRATLTGEELRRSGPRCDGARGRDARARDASTWSSATPTAPARWPATTWPSGPRLRHPAVEQRQLAPRGRVRHAAGERQPLLAGHGPDGRGRRPARRPQRARR